MDEIEAHVSEMIRTSDGPAEVAAALQDSLRYSIRRHSALASDEDLALGATKIGGQPDLPPDTLWPEWRGTPLNFLAQIRLADVAAYDPDGELPHEGMLSFFFDYTNWGKPGRDGQGSLAIVLYSRESEALQRLPWPEALPMRERYAPLLVVSFTRELTAPDFESPIIEQFGYTLNSLYPPDDMSEHALTARRINDVMLDIDTYLHETYDSRALEQLSGRLGRQSVAGVGKPRRRILLGDGLNCHPHRLPERLLGASADPAQDGLDLGKRLFDGREVR